MVVKLNKPIFLIVPLCLVGCVMFFQWKQPGNMSTDNFSTPDTLQVSKSSSELAVVSKVEVEADKEPEAASSEHQTILEMPIKRLREEYQSYNYYTKDTLFSLSKNGDVAASRLLATNFFTELSAAEMNELFALGAGSTAALRVADFDPNQPLVRFRDRQKLKLAGLVAASVIGYPHTAVTIEGIINNLGSLSQDEIQNIQVYAEEKIKFVERYREENGLQPITEISGLVKAKGGVKETLHDLLGQK